MICADVLVAQPSPSLTVVAGARRRAPSAARTARSLLDWSRKGSRFEATCLVAAGGEPFTINFDNQDSAIQHNVAISTDASATTVALVTGESSRGPDQDHLRRPQALHAGTYFFHCDVHPTTMTGTFAVVKCAK